MSAIGAITVCVFSNAGRDLTILNVLDGKLTLNGNPEIAADALGQLARVTPAGHLEEALAAQKESEVEA